MQAINAQVSRIKLSLGPMMAASLVFIMLTWLGIVLNADDIIRELSINSASIRNFSKSPELLLTIGFLGSLATVMITSALMLKSLRVFIAIWLFTLSVAEAQIPVLQQISLVFRYSMMISLFLSGVFYLLTPTYKLNTLQKLGLLVIACLSLELIINPVDTNAILMMPMQLTIFIGILIGLAGQSQHNTLGRKIAYSLVAASVACVVINSLSIIFAEAPFLAGRFRSWYPLPTNFSNNFVLCITPLLWALVDSKKPMVKACMLILILVGTALILLSGTRNAILVLALSITLMTFFWKRRYFAYVVVMGVIVGLIALVLNFSLADFGEAGARIGQVSEHETRYYVWGHALLYIFEKPLLGYGLSTDLTALDKNLPIWEQFNAHNAILGLWLREGALGVILQILLYFIPLTAAFFTLLRRRQSEQELAVLALFFCILMNLWTAGLFEENLTSRASLQQGLWAVAIVMINAELKNLRALTRARFQLRKNALQKQKGVNSALLPVASQNTANNFT